MKVQGVKVRIEVERCKGRNKGYIARVSLADRPLNSMPCWGDSALDALRVAHAMCAKFDFIVLPRGA